MAMQWRSAKGRHNLLEESDGPMCIGISQFYHYLGAENIQWFRRPALSSGQREPGKSGGACPPRVPLFSVVSYFQ